MFTFWQHFIIWILPLALGGGLRFLFRKGKRAWLVTAAGILLTVIACIVYAAAPGFELYFIWIVEGFCFTAASAVTAFLLRPSRS